MSLFYLQSSLRIGSSFREVLSNLLASLGHTEQIIVVGHTNRQTLMKVSELKKITGMYNFHDIGHHR